MAREILKVLLLMLSRTCLANVCFLYDAIEEGWNTRYWKTWQHVEKQLEIDVHSTEGFTCFAVENVFWFLPGEGLCVDLRRRKRLKYEPSRGCTVVGSIWDEETRRETLMVLVLPIRGEGDGADGEPERNATVSCEGLPVQLLLIDVQDGGPPVVRWRSPSFPEEALVSIAISASEVRLVGLDGESACAIETGLAADEQIAFYGTEWQRCHVRSGQSAQAVGAVFAIRSGQKVGYYSFSPVPGLFPKTPLYRYRVEREASRGFSLSKGRYLWGGEDDGAAERLIWTDGTGEADADRRFVEVDNTRIASRLYLYARRGLFTVVEEHWHSRDLPGQGVTQNVLMELDRVEGGCD